MQVRLLFSCMTGEWMRSNTKRSRLQVALFLLWVGLLLGGCASWSERLWIQTPGWSRAAQLGDTATREAIPFVVREDQSIIALMVAPQPAAPGFLLQEITPDGELGWERTIPVSTGIPNDRQFIWDGRKLHLFWLDRGDLFHLSLSPDGLPAGEEEQVSTQGSVGYFATAVNASGEIALWYSGPRNEPGLYALRTGDLASEGQLVDRTGIRPSLQFDRQGELHALWVRYPTGYASDEFYYARLTGASYQPGSAVLILETDIPLSQVMNGPRLGLDPSHGYVAWSVETRTGMSAGDITASYFSFPLEDPGAAKQVRYLRVPSPFALPYQPLSPADGSVVDLTASDLPATSRIFEISFLPGQPDRAVAAFKAEVDYRQRKSQWQIGTLLFERGAPQYYQMMSLTPAESNYPRMADDAQHDLYITWLEGGSSSGGAAYLTSTSPELRNAFDRLSFSDVSQMIAESLFGIASGVVLFWFPLIWMMASLVVLFLTSPLRKEDAPLHHPGTLISLVLALAAFWMAKLFIFPNMFSYVPFSAWIPILPESWSAPLRIGTPLVIGLAAALLAIRFTYARDNRSPLFFTLFYGLTDGLLTLAIYGVIFWGYI